MLDQYMQEGRRVSKGFRSMRDAQIGLAMALSSLVML